MHNHWRTCVWAHVGVIYSDTRRPEALSLAPRSALQSLCTISQHMVASLCSCLCDSFMLL